MFQKLINVWGISSGWLQAARTNAEAARRTRMLPIRLAVGMVLLDFCLIGLWFRYTREMSVVGCAIAGVVSYLVRFSIVTTTMRSACRHYRVSGEALGIRPSEMRSDFRWSSRICALGGSIIVAALFLGFVVVRSIGIDLPPPPELFVSVFDGSFSVLQFAIIAVLAGVVLTVLAPLTEEFVYRSVLLPALACRIGLFPSVAVTSAVFGLAHVIPSGRFWIPIPEIVGGLLMAAGFSIRWSVVPAMVIHAMGNLFAGALIFIYVQLFKAYPTWFSNQ
jgi:membrane protease YdiL (CAAX protease family)